VVAQLLAERSRDGNDHRRGLRGRVGSGCELAPTQIFELFDRNAMTSRGSYERNDS
jgi:hypothetical protein